MELYVFFTEYLLGKMETKAQTAEQVPSWDGNPRGWRRYQREVTWYAMGCKPSVRKYIAPRLITKLTGPARLLAMGWSQQDFQGIEGLKLFIGKLAASPLVRRKLPNTAAVMNQYFQFRRHQNESISNFLVRESLHYEEFVEALLLLKDEKEGKQETFFIPEEDDTEDEEESDTHQQGYRRVPTTEEGGSPSLSTKGKGKGSEAASQRSVGAASGAAPVAADSLDSFILEQLRGWRLLTAAALSPEEWRAVLASTNNKLDYNAVMLLWRSSMTSTSADQGLQASVAIRCSPWKRTMNGIGAPGLTPGWLQLTCGMMTSPGGRRKHQEILLQRLLPLLATRRMRRTWLWKEIARGHKHNVPHRR